MRFRRFTKSHVQTHFMKESTDRQKEVEAALRQTYWQHYLSKDNRSVGQFCDGLCDQVFNEEGILSIKSSCLKTLSLISALRYFTLEAENYHLEKNLDLIRKCRN